MSSEKHVFGNVAKYLSETKTNWNKSGTQTPQSQKFDITGSSKLLNHSKQNSRIPQEVTTPGQGDSRINIIGGALVSLAGKKKLRFTDHDIDLPPDLQSTSPATRDPQSKSTNPFGAIISRMISPAPSEVASRKNSISSGSAEPRKSQPSLFSGLLQVAEVSRFGSSKTPNKPGQPPLSGSGLLAPPKPRIVGLGEQSEKPQIPQLAVSLALETRTDPEFLDDVPLVKSRSEGKRSSNLSQKASIRASSQLNAFGDYEHTSCLDSQASGTWSSSLAKLEECHSNIKLLLRENFGEDPTPRTAGTGLLGTILSNLHYKVHTELQKASNHLHEARMQMSSAVQPVGPKSERLQHTLAAVATQIHRMAGNMHRQLLLRLDSVQTAVGTLGLRTEELSQKLDIPSMTEMAETPGLPKPTLVKELEATIAKLKEEISERKKSAMASTLSLQTAKSKCKKLSKTIEELNEKLISAEDRADEVKKQHASFQSMIKSCFSSLHLQIQNRMLGEQTSAPTLQEGGLISDEGIQSWVEYISGVITKHAALQATHQEAQVILSDIESELPKLPSGPMMSNSLKIPEEFAANSPVQIKIDGEDLQSTPRGSVLSYSNTDLKQRLEDFRFRLLEYVTATVPASELAALKLQVVILNQQLKDTTRKSMITERRGSVLDDQLSGLVKKLDSKNQELITLQQKQSDLMKLVMRTVKDKVMKWFDSKLEAQSQGMNTNLNNLTLKLHKVNDGFKKASKAFRKTRRHILKRSPSNLFDKPTNESEKRIVKFCVDLSKLLNSTISSTGEIDLDNLYDRINTYLTDSYLNEDEPVPEFMRISNPQLQLEARIHQLTKENKDYREEVANLKIENRDLQNRVAKAQNDVENLRSQVNHSRIASSKMGLEIKKLKTMQTYGDQDFGRHQTMGDPPSHTSIMPFMGGTRKPPQRLDSFGENMTPECETKEVLVYPHSQEFGVGRQAGNQHPNHQILVDLFVKEQKELNMLKCRRFMLPSEARTYHPGATGG